MRFSPFNRMQNFNPQGLGSLNPRLGMGRNNQPQGDMDRDRGGMMGPRGGMPGNLGFPDPRMQQSMGGMGGMGQMPMGQMPMGQQPMGGMPQGGQSLLNAIGALGGTGAMGGIPPGPVMSGPVGGMPAMGMGGIPSLKTYKAGGSVEMRDMAQKLQDKGRGGDTILAHINPQEAALLKSLGGAGTINPSTGLPEYWGISIGPIGIGSDHGGLSIGNTSIGDVIDKSGIGDLIGSLGPIAPMAAAYFGGPLAAGIVGGIRRDGSFNFQRALMTGALAYGAQNLAKGLGDAGAASGSGSAASTASTSVPPVSVDDFGVSLLPADAAANAAVAGTGQSAIPAVYADDAGEMLLQADRAAMVPKDTSIGGQMADFGNKAANVARGAYNLSTGAPGAAEAFKASGATMMNTALPMYMGATGVMAADEAEKMQLQAELARAKSEEERNEILARIEASRLRGVEAMKRNPYMFAEGGLASLSTEVPSTSVSGPFNMLRNAINLRLIDMATPSNSDTGTGPFSALRQSIKGLAGKLDEGFPEGTSMESSGGFSGLRGLVDRVLGRIGEIAPDKPYETIAAHAMRTNPYKFAYGGSVDDTAGADDYNAGGVAYMAAGGTTPRFLSGGGDGMSDDIPATINGKQPARLADGEFVIPADVVSHLGNGSSKAGAKQLYSMMDRVRKARTGTAKQGKEIKPTKFMPV